MEKEIREIIENLLLCSNNKKHKDIEWKMLKLVYRFIQEGKVIYNRKNEDFEFIDPIIKLLAKMPKLKDSQPPKLNEDDPGDKRLVKAAINNGYNQAIDEMTKIIGKM